MMFANPQTFLAHVAEQEQIAILFAVESGSRAWGFPSPDSDFDIRFVYARPLDRYLTIEQISDTIEQNSGDLELAGWDVRKALQLMLKGNHTIREWLRSPIQYVRTEFNEKFLDLAQSTPSHVRLAYSYRSLLHEILSNYLPREQDQVSLKKYFYAIRSALVLQWLETHQDDGAVPPMSLTDLLAQQIDPQVRGEIEMLWTKKMATSELGYGPRLAAIDEFVFQHDKKNPLPELGPPSDSLIKRYDQVLKRAVIGGVLHDG